MVTNNGVDKFISSYPFSLTKVAHFCHYTKCLIASLIYFSLQGPNKLHQKKKNSIKIVQEQDTSIKNKKNREFFFIDITFSSNIV